MIGKALFSVGERLFSAYYFHNYRDHRVWFEQEVGKLRDEYFVMEGWREYNGKDRTIYLTVGPIVDHDRS